MRTLLPAPRAAQAVPVEPSEPIDAATIAENGRQPGRPHARRGSTR
ncbi:hypothetical protein QP162_12670 [Sphingomonas aurantiaca]